MENPHDLKVLPETTFNLSQFLDGANDLPPIFVPLTMLFQLGEFGKVEP
jgi:hypothetical protein